MVKWKLFNRSKAKQEEPTDIKMNTKHIGESEQKPMKPETSDESKDVPVKEYNETLYSKGSVQKQHTTTHPESKQPLKRMSWESARTIEQNVDTMGRKQTESFGITSQSSNDTNKKVDRILLKKKSRL